MANKKSSTSKKKSTNTNEIASKTEKENTFPQEKEDQLPIKKRSSRKKKSEAIEVDTTEVSSVEPQQVVLAPAEEAVSTNTRDKYMTLGEHLEELRTIIIRGILVLGVAMLVGLFFGEEIHKFLTTPYRNVLGENATFYQIRLMAPFMIYFKSSFILSALVTFPIQLYLLWSFVAPAVDESQEKYGKLVILFSTLLFWSGLALCWFTAFEKILYFFLVVFQPGDIENKLPIDEYYDIFFNLHLVFGISFQLPIVLVILGRIGILNSSFLMKFWREVTLTLSIAAAVLSPPDLLSMFLLFVPMEILFFVSVLIMKFSEKKSEENV